MSSVALSHTVYVPQLSNKNAISALSKFVKLPLILWNSPKASQAAYCAAPVRLVSVIHSQEIILPPAGTFTALVVEWHESILVYALSV